MTSTVLRYIDFNHHNGDAKFCTRFVQRDGNKWRVWGYYTPKELKDDCPEHTPDKAGERWDATFSPTLNDNVFTCSFEGKEPINNHDAFVVHYCKRTGNFLFINVTHRDKPSNVWYYARNVDCNPVCLRRSRRNGSLGNYA
jgi:hypothetical protein